jgi:hypothetical protein
MRFYILDFYHLLLLDVLNSILGFRRFHKHFKAGLEFELPLIAPFHSINNSNLSKPDFPLNEHKLQNLMI